ncbi:DUF3667 domain-containing protein [Pseudoduganella sp. RAF19]|uniref:DUF3667 domain-containing protein n=2 Tax=unclassified Pseudoduganella TaxID=2637179 RepID=UPI003F9D3C2C
MGVELEAAGDLVTAGLIAHEIEGNAGDQSAHVHSGVCANCGAKTAGNYCGNCGQKTHLHNSVLHLVEELIHGMFHFETKGWRTLPLLVLRPGELTRRFLDGQRTRFVSPLALFLFMMFLMFFVFSLTVGNLNHGAPDKQATPEQTSARLAEKVENRKEQVIEAEADLKAAEGEKGIAKAQAALEKARKKLAAAEEAATKAAAVTTAAGAAAGSSASSAASSSANSAASSPASSPASSAPAAKADDSDSDWDWKKEVKSSNINSDIPWLNVALKHAVENPELALYKLKNAAYKYSFLLVPISMPFLWLMLFWKRGASMFSHAVFSLYSLSFMSLLFVVVAILSYYGFNGTAGVLFCFVPPFHMYKQLRGTYGLTRYEGLWRTCALLFMSVIALTVYSLAVLALSVS